MVGVGDAGKLDTHRHAMCLLQHIRTTLYTSSYSDMFTLRVATCLNNGIEWSQGANHCCLSTPVVLFFRIQHPGRGGSWSLASKGVTRQRCQPV